METLKPAIQAHVFLRKLSPEYVDILTACANLTKFQPYLSNAVSSHPFLRRMSPAHVRILAECAMFTSFEAGQVLFHEGEIASRFYLIQRGKVSLESRAEEIGLVSVQTLGAGYVLG